MRWRQNQYLLFNKTIGKINKICDDGTIKLRKFSKGKTVSGYSFQHKIKISTLDELFEKSMVRIMSPEEVMKILLANFEYQMPIENVNNEIQQKINGEKIVKDMLKFIGEDTEREGLKDTPKRVVKMWKELFYGYDKERAPNVTVFNNGNDGIVVDEMIHDTGNFYSHCEHHMLPIVSGRYYFAYVPNPKGNVLGLSKIGRVVDYYSARLQVQERLVSEVLNHLNKSLSKSDDNWYKPLGMGLVMEAEHLCKTIRGVKKEGQMRTTKLIGTFKTDPAARAEFLDWVNMKSSR